MIGFRRRRGGSGRVGSRGRARTMATSPLSWGRCFRISAASLHSPAEAWAPPAATQRLHDGRVECAALPRARGSQAGRGQGSRRRRAQEGAEGRRREELQASRTG